jgi:chromosome segregation ATPase
LERQILEQILQKLDGMQHDIQSIKGEVQTIKGEVQTIKGDLQSLKGDVESVKKEQLRHGDLLHQLITNVGSLGKRYDELDKKIDSNHIALTSEISGLRKDIEFINRDTAENRLEIHRVKTQISN